MPRLTVQLFGKLNVQRDGRAITCLPAGKTQELLCYLLLHRDRSHPREFLAGLLWGEHDTAGSKKCLRQALWQLQNILFYTIDNHIHRLILAERDSVCFNSAEAVWIDAAVFERATVHMKPPGQPMLEAEANELKTAVDLYRADLLEGWYQDWCLVERERFQNLYLTM